MVGKFSKIVATNMRWEQVHWGQRSHQLIAGEVTYATLEWPQLFRTLGLASSSEGEHSFKRGGFLHPYITIYRKDSQVELARLTVNWRGSGDLVFINGQRFHFARHGTTRYQYDVSDGRGDLLFKLEKEWGGFKHHGDVHVFPAGECQRDIALLITLCWYLVVMLCEDAQAAAAST